MRAKTCLRQFGVLVSVAALAFAPTSAATAQTKQKKAIKKGEPAACASLHKDYALVGKRLAMAKVNGAMGGQADKLRAQQEATSITTEGSMTLEMLRSNGCKMPTALPDRDTYLLQAMDCYNAIRFTPGLTAPPPACALENWKP